MYDENVLKGFLEIAEKGVVLSGITPPSPEFETTSCTLDIWTISVGIILEALFDSGKQVAADRMKGILYPPFRDAKDDLSSNAKIFLQNNELLQKHFDHATQEWKAMFTQFGKSLDTEKMYQNIKKIYNFLANNPNGIEGKFSPSPGSNSILKTPTEESKSSMSTQKLFGKFPTKTKGKELIIDKKYWLVGFSSLCDFGVTGASIAIVKNKYMDLRDKTLLDVPFEVDYITNETFSKFLNVLLHARKDEFLRMVQTAWDYPQIGHFIKPEINKFDKKSFLNSMKELRGFMKSNQGFKS